MSDTLDTPMQRIGRYEVRGELGTGGMSVVYRAHDPRLDRDVAVKVLHPHLARDQESRARFEREARAAARLRHPNIVEVYEFSDADERESYMVTELLEGPTLRRFVEQHPDVPAEVAAAVGVVLCDALACAHAQGVVHRDVKPDNLMLQRGQLKLTDFGIAHVADGKGMTITGQVLGSPAHMSPEQIEGLAVDARTDVFAAGTVLYLLATGRLPFEATTAHALLRKILDGEYAPPERVAPAVGHRFDAILRKALARKPDDRYPSAEALRGDLCAFVKEAGWEFPEQELRHYFEDPDGFVAALKERLKERLPELGERARRAGDIGEAMGYFNRALALDPGNARVLALVRGVARRRQMLRVARTAGIVGGAATLTAIVAVAVIESRVPPKPAPAVVAPEAPPHDRAEPTPVIVRATEGPRQEPAAAPDASADAPAVAERADAAPARTAGHPARNGGGGSTVMGAREELREVVLRPYPQNVRYSINGGDWVEWSSQNPTLGTYPVDRQLRLVVEAPPGSAYGRREWIGVIRSGFGPQSISVRLPPRTLDASAAAATVDGGASRVN